MKKLFAFILFTVFGLASHAQTTFSVTHTPCNNDGILSATFPGTLTPPLTVYWTTHGTSGSTITHSGVSGLSDDLTGYSGGPISIYAIDAHGVTGGSGYYGGMPPFSIGLTATTAMCPNFDTATVSVSGGTAPYTYQWYNTGSMALVGTLSSLGLPPGDYGVTVTDAHGCVYGSMDDGNLFDSLTQTPSFYDSVSTTPANCTNGSATATNYGGGLPPFSYVWSNAATTASISGLSMGPYAVTVTDAAGCTATGYGYVSQGIVISAPVTPTPTTCTESNGAVIAFGSGGLPPYTYAWSNGATTQSQTGLPAGAYEVTVTDANNCVGTGYGYVSASTPITVTYSSTSSLCTGPTGTATAYPTGGTIPYSIEWYTWPTPQTTITASALSPGDYAFKITDNVGCIQTGTAHIHPVDVISVSNLVTDPVCTLSNGSITVYPTGGVLPYHYSWSTGGATSSITGVPAGGYSMTVTDALSCSVTKTYDLSSSSPVGIGLTVTPSSCLFASDGSITATPYDGTPPYSYSWTGGGATSTISSLPHGYYWVNVTDANGCTAWDSTTVPYDTSSYCYCTIAGRIYWDINGNCIHDPGEPGVPNIQVLVSGRGYTYTDDSGYYSMPVPSGTYTVTETVRAFYPLSSCQVNNIPVTTVASAGCVDSVDFANSMDTIHDMHISTWDYYNEAPIAGHTYTQLVLVSNQGTVPEDSVYAIYNPDGQLLAPTVTPASIFNGSSYYYTTADSFPTVNPGFSKSFFMTYNVPTDIPLGISCVFLDSVAYKAPITDWLTDYTPWNNVNYFTTTTIGSYDPNFKEVYPKGYGPQGYISYNDSVLEYMVHFQNTGTYQAQNIVVIDTIDDNLDWTTLSPEYMSAPCKVILAPSGAKKVATFTFSNINLPAAASNPMGSNGVFTYTIHLKPGLAIGTQFHNTASIYFDYNAPVRTNTTLNTLQSAATLGTTQPTAAQNYNTFTIYPNPAGNSFNAVITAGNASVGFMTVSDMTGKQMIAKTITLQQGTQTIATDAGLLAPGVYFVSMNINGSMQTQKLVILKP